MSAKDPTKHVMAFLREWARKLSQERLLVTLGAVLVLAGFVLIGIGSYQRSAAYRSRIVSLRMAEIGELSTQAAYFTNVQVISNSREIFGVTVPFTQSKYVYSYDGVIKAGVDFSRITWTPDDCRRTVTVSMPPAYVTDIDVDENSLEVYNEAQSIFTPLTLSDIQASRQQMEIEAREQAVANGLLEAATANARALIEAFLKSETEMQDYAFNWIITEEEVHAP